MPAAMGDEDAGTDTSLRERTGGTTIIIPSGDEVTERLAEVLYLKMEHLEPADGLPWSCLGNREREFYRSCVESVLVEVIALARSRSRKRERP